MALMGNGRVFDFENGGVGRGPTQEAALFRRERSEKRNVSQGWTVDGGEFMLILSTGHVVSAVFGREE